MFCGTCPAPYVCDLQSRMARQVPRMPWHPVPRRAASAVLAGRCFDLQSADWCCNLRLAYQTAFGLYPWLFYKESAFCFDCLFWLHQGRIPRHTCRFYCCLAAHQRTKEMDSAEPLSSILWTLTPHPGESAAAGHDCCRGLGAILDSGIRCRSIIPSSEFYLAVCVRAWAVRVSVGLLGWYRTFFIVGGMDCLCLRLLVVLLWSIVGFALTAVGAIVLADNGMEKQIISSLNRTNAFSIMVLPSQFGEMSLHQRNWYNSRGQR